MARGKAIRIGALSVLGLALLLFLFHRFHLSGAEILQRLEGSNPLWIGVAFCFTGMTILTRAYRFHVFFPELTLREFVPVTMIYNGLAVSLPGGAGEAGFALFLRRRIGRSLVAIGGRLLLTRMLDLLTLCVLLMAISPLLGHLPAGSYETLLRIFMAIALALSVFTLGLLYAIQNPRARVLALMPARLKQRLQEEAPLGSHVLTVSIAVTALNRVLGIVSYIALFAALHLHIGILDAVAVYCTVNLLLALPVQGLFGAGSVDLWWTLALASMGLAGAAATASAVAIHFWLLVFSLLPALAAGGYSALASAFRNQRVVMSSPPSRSTSGPQSSTRRASDESK